MTRPLEFKTTDIELAASLMSGTNQKPLSITLGAELCEFSFPDNATVHTVVMKYAAGTLLQEVRRLAQNRSWLYRQIKEVLKRGHDNRAGRIRESELQTDRQESKSKKEMLEPLLRARELDNEQRSSSMVSTPIPEALP